MLHCFSCFAIFDAALVMKNPISGNHRQGSARARGLKPWGPGGKCGFHQKILVNISQKDWDFTKVETYL
jgi:hypothetical protein